MSTPQPPPTTTWQVTGTMEKTQIGPDGTPAQGLTVNFTTGTGQSGSVWLPKSGLSADAVRAAIAPAAALRDQIYALTSES